MMLLALTSGWLLSVLAGDMLIGFGLGWFASALRQRVIRAAGHGKRPAADAARKPVGHVSQPQSLMEEVRGALAAHAEALAQFEQWLTPDTVVDDGRHSRPTAAKRIDEVRQANRKLDRTLDDTIEQLSQIVETYRDLFRAELDRLDHYRRQAEHLDGDLAELDVDQPPSRLAETVFEKVHDLRQTNGRLQVDLEDCQRQLAEQTARAKAAENDARVDVLTQLPNRRCFEEKLAELRSLYQRRAQPYVLVLFDIDHFKAINDTYGHTTGDAVLAMLGRVLRKCRRATDHVSRFGGEEFALLVPLCSEDRAEAVAERYRQRVEAASLRYEGQRLQVTVSAGIAPVTSDHTNDTPLERADIALYAAKRAGGNQTCVRNGVPHAAPESREPNRTT